jgi:hypothetical protein
MGTSIISWNTERQYSPEGQRISAAWLSPGVIVFVDLDRHIEGVIECNELSNVTVMYHYDHGYYRGTSTLEEFELARHLKVMRRMNISA